MNLEIKTLHNAALDIATQFRRAESALIDILQLIDEKKVFLRLGYTSLFDYSVKALKLSESTSSNFIVVARKSKSIPELKAAIASGDLTVSKARKITPVLTQGNQAHWIELAKTLPKHKLEKEIAKLMPETATPEKARYVSETRIELKMGVSEVLLEKFKQAQNLLSQKLRKSATLEETLSEMVECFLLKLDPVKRAMRGTRQLDSVISDGPASVPGTRYLSASLKHKIRLRDGFQCGHTNDKGERCNNKRWLEIHHRTPLFQGGTNSLSNLETLCSAHHKMQHH